ncbi:MULTISPECIES: ParE family toxin-like protein [unclassified Microcoleus]|uniref:ParE family toxin-like protein n=1 Tax=unclassified Microcoleus TaxID=2642155 RepID=UPI002FD77AF5
MNCIFSLSYRKSATPKIQELADKNYELLKVDSKHPSLHFKRIGSLWSVRVGRNYRALGFDKPEGVLWFWIGFHGNYDAILDRK